MCHWVRTPRFVSRLWLGGITVASAFLCANARAATIDPLLRGWMSRGDGDRCVAVWVTFTDRGFASESEHAAALAAAQGRIDDAALGRRALVGAALADDGDLPVAARYREAVARFGAIRVTSRWLNAVSATISLRDVDEIAALPFVRDVRPVARLLPAGPGPRRDETGRLLEQSNPGAVVHRPSGAATASVYGPSYGQLNEIGVIATQAAGYTGARVVLEMIDTGFRKDHAAFRTARILNEYDFINHDHNTQNEDGDDPEQHWHGTATWSTAGGYDPGNIVGPAYRAGFLLAKTEDITSERHIEEDNYVHALEWGDSLGVQVTSASLAYKCFDDGTCWTYQQLNGHTAPISIAIDHAAGLGILCVNAMGNDGPAAGSLDEPADADSMMACGAVDSLDVIANFSSRGPTSDGRTKPEVVARGRDTWCADANGIDTYAPASGTSLSTPLVGGSCALVLEAHPEWSALRARLALLLTADRAGHPDNNYGFGRINVWQAIQQAPIVVPVPFSLLAPANGDSEQAARPTFRWNASHDPAGGGIQYELWIDETPDFATPIVYSSIPDTTFTIPDPLAPQSLYYWRVFADGSHGYRRLSREDWSFRTQGSSAAGDLPGPVNGWRITASPNPWQGGSSLRWYAPPGSYHQQVRFSIFDATGRRMHDETRVVSREGWNELPWTPRGADGERLASGVYLAMLEASGRTAKTRIVLTR